MTKKPILARTSLDVPPREKNGQTLSREKIITTPESAEPRRLWLWLTLLLLVGVLALSVVGYTTWNWLRSLPLLSSEAAVQPAITTLPVGRTLPYADLSFTVLNAQYATSFSDDTIRAGPALVRLNMRVANQTSGTIALVYYEIARLLVPQKAPIAPANAQLAASVPPQVGVEGWLDFPVQAGVQLSSLKLQLGSAALGETLVVLPVSGAFHPQAYAGYHSPQSLVISYYFEGSTLIYHLNSIDVRYSYNGSEVTAGKQFYVLNFTVDNPNGIAVSPGYGFDYIRLVINGNNLPPIDTTLPNTFKAGARSAGGHVTYVAQAGMKSLTIAFLRQLVSGQENYPVSL
jgi:hypothetical protein